MFKINTIKTYNIPSKAPIHIGSSQILGSGNRKILILAQSNKEDVILKEEFELLSKILSALKLETNDVWITNPHLFPSNSISDYKNAFNFDKIIVFGVDEKSFFNMEIPKNYPLPFMNFEVLSSNSLNLMLDEKNKKMKTDLWLALKDWIVVN